MGYLDSIRKVTSSDFSKATVEEKDRAARDIIEVCSLACAGLVLQPIPGLEQAVLPVQAGMVVALAHIYEKEVTKKRATEIILDIAAITGVSILGRAALTTVAKIFLPVVGGIITAPYTFSVTWATGFAAIHYLRSGGKPDASAIKKIFEQERARSKSHYDEGKARANRPSEDQVKKDVEETPKP